jgi:hypothetical protein
MREKPSHIFNTFFYDKLVISSDHYTFSNISRWSRVHPDTPFVLDRHVIDHKDGTRRLNWFSYDKVIIPINQKTPGSVDGWHWFFIGKIVLSSIISTHHDL